MFAYEPQNGDMLMSCLGTDALSKAECTYVRPSASWIHHCCIPLAITCPSHLLIYIYAPLPSLENKVLLHMEH